MDDKFMGELFCFAFLIGLGGSLSIFSSWWERSILTALGAVLYALVFVPMIRDGEVWRDSPAQKFEEKERNSDKKPKTLKRGTRKR